MIGTGSVVNPALGLLLAAGQVPADIPEGFAATAALKRAGFPRRVRLLMAASFTLPVLIGATIGYFALRQAPEILTLSVLAATGGVLMSMVVEEIVTEAHDGATSRFGPLLLTAGFALFAIISVYVTVENHPRARQHGYRTMSHTPLLPQQADEARSMAEWASR